MKSIMKNVLAIGILACSVVTTSNATVVFSDNFEADTVGIPAASLINWTVTSPSVDLVGGERFGVLCNNNLGGKCLDMEGSPGNGDITTTVGLNLLAGTYTFSFDYGNNGTGDNSLAWSVGSLASGSVTSGAANQNNYTTLTSVFVVLADQANVFINFVAGGVLNNQGTVLDNVKLERTLEPVVVSAPSAVMLILLAAFGLAVRKK